MIPAEDKIVRLQSFAKINLGLEITGKRADGYHYLKTIFQTIDLADSIEITPNKNDSISLAGDDNSITWDETNTVYRAFKSFFQAFGVSHGFDVYVKKKIPHGSGLGGGSSNAAVILLFLLDYFKDKIQPDNNELISLAARIGADVPFFLVGGTVLAEGIGEQMTPLDDMQKKTVCIVIPPVKVSTGLIFSQLTLTRKRFDSKIDTYLNSGNLSSLVNHLEEVTFKCFPEVRQVKDKMLDNTSCELVMMSGSGSAVYCIAGADATEYLRSSVNHTFPTGSTTNFVVNTINRNDYLHRIGAWPSGKAPVFGAGIRRFESSRPRISQ